MRYGGHCLMAQSIEVLRGVHLGHCPACWFLATVLCEVTRSLATVESVKPGLFARPQPLGRIK